MKEQDPEKWIRELVENGWLKVKINIWQSPQGVLYRGPYQAWKVMQKEREGNSNQ